MLKGIITTANLHLEKGANCARKKLFLEAGSCTNSGIERKDAGIRELLAMAASLRYYQYGHYAALGLDHTGLCQTPLHRIAPDSYIMGE